MIRHYMDLSSRFQTRLGVFELRLQKIVIRKAQGTSQYNNAACSKYLEEEETSSNRNNITNNR